MRQRHPYAGICVRSTVDRGRDDARAGERHAEENGGESDQAISMRMEPDWIPSSRRSTNPNHPRNRRRHRRYWRYRSRR